MPEIWLNYGPTDIVLDIMAENLEQKIDSEGKILQDNEISEKLEKMNLFGQTDMVVLHNSKSIQKMLSSLFTLCEQKSRPPPRILADPKILGALRAGLPASCPTGEFDAKNPDNLVFVSEVEFDGLFGYETAATRILRRFGAEEMLSAYAKRHGNLPAPGHRTESLEEAKKFADRFEIGAIEIVANSAGIVEIVSGHPAKTMSAADTLESGSIRDAGQHKSVIVSTGKHSSNDTLARSLQSLWNCAGAIKKDGLAVLVAECGDGLGSEALRQYVEGRLSAGQLQNPSRYVDGMEGLLFLSEMRKSFQTGLVSILPEFYAKKLGLVPLAGIKHSMDYILKTQGPRQKVAVVSDGARLLLR